MRESGKNSPFPVSVEATDEFESNLEILLIEMENRMENIPDIGRFVGGQIEMMRQNHRHHAIFMLNVFRLNDLALLDHTVGWVYRAYMSHGFSADYFTLELGSWMEIFDRCLSKECASQIKPVYEWILAHHEKYTAQARLIPEQSSGENSRRTDIESLFLEGLVTGDSAACRALATESVKTSGDLEDFYRLVVEPAMKEIGNRWEKGILSVSQEHLATAIVSRTLSSLFMTFWHPAPIKAKAIISASPNEFHELGARIVADLLEMNGWKVSFLGSNLPCEEIIARIRQERPLLVGLSVTIPFNIGKAAEIIRKIRSDPEISETKVLVGGKAFNDSGELWIKLGADACPANANEALNVANSFVKVIP